MRVIRPNLTREVDRAFGRLRTEVRAFESVDVDNERTLSAVSEALQFMRRWQNHDGSWAQGAMMNVSLALHALTLWESDECDWQVHSGAQGGFERSWGWLERKQEGAVWENVWNTALIVQAGSRLKWLYRPPMERAVQWLLEEEKSEWGLRSGLPIHHVAQAVVCFDSLGCFGERDRAAAALHDFLQSEPPLSAYMAGQALGAFVCAGISTENGPGLRLTRIALEALQTEHVSISNFVDICSSFKGLGAALGGVSSRDQTLERTVANFFSPARLRPDGSWYSDLTFTAFALIAMTEVRETRRIVAYPRQVYGPLEDTRLTVTRLINSEVRQEHRVAAAAGAAGVMASMFVVLLVLLTAGSISIAPESDLGWFVAPVILGAVGWLVRYAWSRSSPTR